MDDLEEEEPSETESDLITDEVNGFVEAHGERWPRYIDAWLYKRRNVQIPALFMASPHQIMFGRGSSHGVGHGLEQDHDLGHVEPWVGSGRRRVRKTEMICRYVGEVWWSLSRDFGNISGT